MKIKLIHIAFFFGIIAAKAADTTKPWTFWWWHGSEVDKANITWQLEKMAAAGMGGVHIIPIYGVKGLEDKELKFMSQEWLNVVDHTVKEAERLGMGVDMTLGTGWPYGGKAIDVSNNAGTLIFDIFTCAGLLEFKQNIGVKDQKEGYKASLQAVVAMEEKGQSISLKDKMQQDGILTWKAPAGNWKIFAFYSGKTFMHVKRSPPSGDGLVMDHLSIEAFNKYTTWFDSCLKVANRSKFPALRALYSDSYQIYGGNWPNDFLQQFQRRKGYDLSEYLPLLVNMDVSIKARQIRCDYREIVSDLLYDQFSKPATDYAHSKGMLFRNQSHGSPGNILDYYSTSDIPETEIFGSSKVPVTGIRNELTFPKHFGHPDVLIGKFASSASHWNGIKLTSSETCTWLDNHFKVSLSQVKPEIDRLFLAGINHIFYHGMTYSPKDEPWPGWLFYAPTNFNYNSHFWNHLPLLNRYVKNCQSRLQEGEPDPDVLLYFPIHDVWTKRDSAQLVIMFTSYDTGQWFFGTEMEQTARMLWRKGTQFDYVSDRMLAQTERWNVKKTPILIPFTAIISLAGLVSIKKLVDSGVPIYFLKRFPVDIAGYDYTRYKRRLFNELRQALLNNPNVKIISDLESLSLPSETIASKGLEFIRLAYKSQYRYFIVNHTADNFDDQVAFNYLKSGASQYDPLTGKRENLKFENGKARLSLKSGQSVFIENPIENMPVANFKVEKEVIILNGKWKVDFLQGHPILPTSYTSQKLESWTTSCADTMAKYFSGTARYTLSFDAPVTKGTAYQLQLSGVRESAVIKLNKQILDTLWCVPFQTNIPSALFLSKGNLLEIEVTNLSANRITWLEKQNVPWKKFHNVNIVGPDYKLFDASAWQPEPSGLTDEVKLVVLTDKK